VDFGTKSMSFLSRSWRIQDEIRPLLSCNE
jgi:hypothetical protein